VFAPLNFKNIIYHTYFVFKKLFNHSEH